MTEENKENRMRVSGFVSEEAYNKLLTIQSAQKYQTGKKPTMGEVIEKIVKNYTEK